MKNRSTVYIATVFLSVLIIFTGCNRKTTSTNKQNNANDNQIVLTVWESSNGPDEFIKQAAEAYTAKHPDIKISFVNVELGESSGQIYYDGPAGVGADLFAAPHDKITSLVNDGLILPTVKPELVKSQVLEVCSLALIKDDVMYGYPVSAETVALFYNKSLISDAEVPLTWEDLAVWTKDFNEKEPKKQGFVMDVGSGYYTIIFTTANGNRLFGPNGTDASSSRLNTEDAIMGMKLFQSFRSFLNIPSSDLSVSFCNSSFASGNAAMYVTGLWNVNRFEEAGINFGVAPLPSLPGDVNPSASFTGVRAMFVSSYSKHPEEAADFARFLLTPEMQTLRFKLTGAMPSVNIDVSSRYLEGFFKQLNYSFLMPSIPEMDAFWTSFGRACSHIWDGGIVEKELEICDKELSKQQ